MSAGEKPPEGQAPGACVDGAAKLALTVQISQTLSGLPACCRLQILAQVTGAVLTEGYVSDGRSLEQLNAALDHHTTLISELASTAISLFEHVQKGAARGVRH